MSMKERYLWQSHRILRYRKFPILLGASSGGIVMS